MCCFFSQIADKGERNLDDFAITSARIDVEVKPAVSFLEIGPQPCRFTLVESEEPGLNRRCVSILAHLV